MSLFAVFSGANFSLENCKQAFLYLLEHMQRLR